MKALRTIAALAFAGALMSFTPAAGWAATASAASAATGTLAANGEMQIVEPSEGQPYVEGQVLVAYADGSLSSAKQIQQVDAQAQGALEEAGAAVEAVVAEADAADETQGTTVVASIPESTTVEEAVEELSDEPGIAYVQPNYVYTLADEQETSQAAISAAATAANATTAAISAAATASSATAAAGSLLAQAGLQNADTSVTTNDTYFSKQWYLESAGFTKAWSHLTGASTVTVAVLDTGCKLNHEDLQANLNKTYAYDVTTGRNLKYSSGGGDTQGHGTHVCGIIGATANNGTGVAGAAYNKVSVLPVKVFCDEGATSATVVAGYNRLAELISGGFVTNLHVVNLSLGYYPDSTSTVSLSSEDKLMSDAILNLRDNYGVLTVAAGGNGINGVAQTSPCMPADLDQVVSVTSLTQQGTDSTWSDYNQYKDISAPGETIASTWNTTSYSYKNESGTSMASPVVASAAALLWSVDSSLQPDQVVDALQQTATAVPSQTSARKALTGSAGALDADAAVEYVLQQSERTSLADATISGVVDKTFTGKAQTQSISVTLNGEKLTQGEDYYVKYYNNTQAGTAKVLVFGQGEYGGMAQQSFTIAPGSLSKLCTVSVSETKLTYTGSVCKPTTTVKLGSTKLTLGTDYTLSYSGACKKVGAYKVTITGKGNYTGSVKKTFKIIPRATWFTSLVRSGNKATLKWKKRTTQVSGYQLQYSTSKTFASSKTKKKTFSKTSTTKKKLTSLKRNKRYYVRVRTYKKVNGVKYYSAWSNIATFKTS